MATITGKSSKGAEIVNGTPENDTIFPLGGFDVVNGGAGIDTVSVMGNRAKFNVSANPELSFVDSVSGASGNQNMTTLNSVERLEFNDVSVALDVAGHAGQTAKLLGVVFGAASLSNKQFVGIGLSLLDEGMSYEQLAGLAVSAAGKTTHADVVALLWFNLFRSAPSAEQAAPVVAALDAGLSVGALTVAAAELSTNAVNINLVGLMLTGIEFVV